MAVLVTESLAVSAKAPSLQGFVTWGWGLCNPRLSSAYWVSGGPACGGGRGAGERLASWGQGRPFLRVQSAPVTPSTTLATMAEDEPVCSFSNTWRASLKVPPRDTPASEHQPACRSLDPSTEEQTVLRALALRDPPHPTSFSLVPQRGGNILQLLLWWRVSVLLFTFSALQTQWTSVSSFLSFPFLSFSLTAIKGS